MLVEIRPHICEYIVSCCGPFISGRVIVLFRWLRLLSYCNRCTIGLFKVRYLNSDQVSNIMLLRISAMIKLVTMHSTKQDNFNNIECYKIKIVIGMNIVLLDGEENPQII